MVEQTAVAAGAKRAGDASPRRWVMLAVLSFDICVGYMPYYTFVPIIHQGMMTYGADESSLNVLCILYAIAFIPGALFTGPVVGSLGCRGAFILATLLICIGCCIRLGPGVCLGQVSFLSGDVSRYAANGPPDLSSVMGSYNWLVVGQGLCAAGLPLLVNSTSEMGADWFPPRERPAAGMISNLMNFIGGSLSFVLPPLFVADDLESLVVTHQQIQSLLAVQLAMAATAFVLTLLCYESVPRRRLAARAPRKSVLFLAEVRCMLALPDFWIVNGQFAIYLSICQAFDALEGSMLESAGYSASLTQWTGIACATTSIITTLLESRCITSASSYRRALIVSNGFMAASMVIALLCLRFHLDERVFVLAVAVMGMTTPGWGCSCELGSEVAFPARESTVSSFLEAFGNLCSVGCIVGAQYLIDAKLEGVLLSLLAVAALLGAGLLSFLSGRLRRSEAEVKLDGSGDDVGEPEPEAEADELDGVGCHWRSALRYVVGAAFSADRHRSRRLCCGFLRVVPFAFLGLFLVLPRGADLRLDVAERIPLAAPEVLSPASPASPRKPRGVVAKRWRPKPPKGGARAPAISTGGGAWLANGLAEPRVVVIHCRRDERHLARFRRSMALAGLNFNISSCITGRSNDILAAVDEGLLPPAVRNIADDASVKGRKRATTLGKALAHMRVWKSIANDSSATLNIFHDDEVVSANFRARRRALLESLPPSLDFVNLNALRPAGTVVRLKGNASKLVRGTVYRMRGGLRPNTNAWMGNYIVTSRGAQRLLEAGRSFDAIAGAGRGFVKHLHAKLFAASEPREFVGFAVQTNKLSMHCEKLGKWMAKGMCGV